MFNYLILKDFFNRFLKSNYSDFKVGKSSNRAFSLLEVSIVILIIGVLIAGVISARIMIKNSRIASAQAITRSAAVNSVPGAVIWLESSLEESFDAAESEDEESLSGWGDIKTGSSHPLNSAVVFVETGADEDVIPEYSNTINDIQAVKFHGADDSYMTINGETLNSSDYTIFVLEKRQASNSNYFVGNPASSTEGESLLLGYKSGTSIIHSHDGSGEDVGYDSTVSDYSSNNEHPRIFTFVQNESTGKKTYINGYLAGENANADQLTNIGDALELGKGYNGEIGEFLVFERALRNEERKSIEQYLQKKWRIKNFSETDAACTTGEITDEGCADNCSVSILGSSSTVSPVSDGAIVEALCNDSGYDLVKIEATCSGGVAITGTCGCASGYDDSDGGICKEQCDLADITGLASETVSSGASGSKACDTGSGFTGTIDWSCSNGTPTADTGTCGISCITASQTGITDGTEVTQASGTQSCNADNFTGDVTYTCEGGVFTKDSGQECDTCAAGYSFSGSDCVLSTTPFITTWDTTQTGTSSSTQITLPLVSSGTYNFLIDWGADGDDEGTENDTDVITAYNQAEITHTYTSPGTYIVKIYGDVTGWKFNNGGDKLKLTNISQWGDLRLNNEQNNFRGCANLTITTSDALNTEGNTLFAGMFNACSSIVTIPNIGSWDMSNATSLQAMFYNMPNFNDGSINNWDTSNVENLQQTFTYNYSFNQDLSNWDTSKVENMYLTFAIANSFDQDLSSWNISSLTNATHMFKGASSEFSTENYNKLLAGWAAQAPNIQSGVTFNGGSNSTYDTASGGVNGVDAKAILTDTYNWTITDGGEIPVPLDCSGGVGTPDITSVPGKKIHTFSAVGTSQLTCLGQGNLEILVVGGGGGGFHHSSAGTGANLGGGGGGSGGIGYISSYAVDLSSSTNYAIKVGAGGASGGGESSFATSLIVANGGGRGGWSDSSGNSGGSGGGMGRGANDINDYGGTATKGSTTIGATLYGNNGGSTAVITSLRPSYFGGSGGGGAGQEGSMPALGSSSHNTEYAGAGGDGVQFNMFGSSEYYGGGGGGFTGGTTNSRPIAAGGQGGGGHGGRRFNGYSGATLPEDGEDGKGGGGGGGHISSGKGGSGIVIIRYDI